MEKYPPASFENEITQYIVYSLTKRVAMWNSIKPAGGFSDLINKVINVQLIKTLDKNILQSPKIFCILRLC